MLNERLVRPAMVVASEPPETVSEGAEAGSSEK